MDNVNGRTGPRVLIFNQQGREEAIDFLDGLYDASKHDATGRSFDRVIFCTNVTYANASYKPGKYDAVYLLCLFVSWPGRPY